MKSPSTITNGASSQLVLVRSEPAGQFTACLVGLPELRATATTRGEAVQQVSTLLQQWLASGQLETVSVALTSPPMEWFGHTNPNDADERAYLEELARARQEDLKRTLGEYEQE
jgi:hypothetical protein